MILGNDLNSTDNTWHNLDGGSLMEIMAGKNGKTFESIFQCYVNHTLNLRVQEKLLFITTVHQVRKQKIFKEQKAEEVNYFTEK